MQWIGKGRESKTQRRKWAEFQDGEWGGEALQGQSFIHLPFFRAKGGWSREVIIPLDCCKSRKSVPGTTLLWYLLQLARRFPAPSPRHKEIGQPHGLSNSFPDLPFSKSWHGPVEWGGPRIVLAFQYWKRWQNVHLETAGNIVRAHICTHACTHKITRKLSGWKESGTFFSFKFTHTEFAISKWGKLFEMERVAHYAHGITTFHPENYKASMHIHTQCGHCLDTAALKIYYRRIFCHW